MCIRDRHWGYQRKDIAGMRTEELLLENGLVILNTLGLTGTLILMLEMAITRLSILRSLARVFPTSLVVSAAAVSYTHLDVYKRQVLK